MLASDGRFFFGGTGNFFISAILQVFTLEKPAWRETLSFKYDETLLPSF
jgi:hypothetical protein